MKLKIYSHLLLLRRFVVALCCALVFLVFPSSALAVDVVTAWTLPAPNTNYAFISDVVVTGEWTLPADWLGNIYVYQDGTQMHDSAHPTANCNLVPAPAGCYIPISNVGNVASAGGTFSFNLGPQMDGSHNIQIKFWGGQYCAIKFEINAVTPGAYPPEEICQPTEDNFNAGQIYPIRTYTVNMPLNPRFTVTPATNPALDYGNVTTGQNVLKSFTVKNTGQQTLSFSVSGIAPPYYCYGACTNVPVSSNQTKSVTIQFVPQAVGSYPATLTFTCSGNPLPCDVPSLSRTITGNATGVDLPPKVTIVSGTPVDFGSFYLGNPTSVTNTITLKNTGGGLLTGTISLPTGEYVCVGGCAYSLLAGDTITKSIVFTPNHVDLNRNDAAFLSDAGSGATTVLRSSVSDTPVLSVCVWDGYSCLSGWTIPGKVNIGTFKEISVYVKNIGGGNLSGVITGLPSQGFSFVPAPGYPYQNISGGTGMLYVGKFRFDPQNALVANADALFSNDTPPGGNTVNVHLTAQGNDQPIGGYSSASISFGSVVVNTTVTRTFTVTNNGVGTLSVSVPNGALANPAFSCVSNCSADLGGGESVTMTFSFTPTATISYFTTVNIGGTNIPLSGNGIQPGILAYAWDNNGAQYQFPFAQTIDYGATIYGSPVQDKLQYIQIQSIGGPGTRVNYSVDTSAAPHFPCTNYCSGTVSTDAPYWWYVNPAITFKPGNAPAGPGDYTETITVTYDFNDGVPRTYVYQVHGSSASAPYMTVSPTSASWPATIVGNAPTKVFTVRNEGIGPLSGTVGVTNPGALVGRWTFDSGDMDWPGKVAFDTSGQGNNGSLLNSPSSVSGVNDTALHVSGGGYVNLGTNSTAFNFSGDVSAAAWIRTTSNGRMILQYQNGNPLIYMSVGPTTAGGTSNRLVVYLRTNSGGVAVFSGNAVVNDGNWHHVAFVRSVQAGVFNGVVRLYVDGSLDSSFTYADNGPISTSGGGHSISQSGGYAFSGDIDEVNVYSRALSSSDIRALSLSQPVTLNPIFRCINPSPCVFTNLNSGMSQDFTFSFNPEDAFYYSSIIPFTAENGQLVNVSMSGTGVFQPMIQITPTTVTDPSTYVGPYNFLDLGTANLGTYKEKNVRIWNVGRGPLNGNTTFNNGTHFSSQPASSGGAFSVPEGSYQDFTIRFAPLAINGLDDAINFSSNAFNGTQVMNLHGFGIFASIINILGSGQTFPSVVIGRWKEQNITIKNTGTVDFGTGTFGISGPFKCMASSAGPLDPVTGNCPYRLDAGGTTVITVRFTPIVVGPVNGLVSLSTLSLANFYVTGTGVPPSVKYIEK